MSFNLSNLSHGAMESWLLFGCPGADICGETLRNYTLSARYKEYLIYLSDEVQLWEVQRDAPRLAMKLRNIVL